MTDQRTSTSIEPDQLPLSRGWTSAALAVYSVRQISSPMLLQLDVINNGSIVIDFRHNAFACDSAMSQFPRDPAGVTVQTQPITMDAPAIFALPGQDLDALLWMMGLNSFELGPASWLRPADRYRLRRWPNLTGLSHSIDQMRMIAMLSNTFLTAGELAQSIPVELSEAQRLINALSLMGILRVSAAAQAPVIAERPPIAVGEKTLFQRLRERLGL